ncbi:N-acetylmuramoyl-L-alanine amidase [Actinoplanes oblitus]|uniref:N-acetylmuramoyl-L-alanine amidase n=1 Tax=Actinoplanes oblitus TaxID=3040509 RepID=A0ABY8WBM3_9ACTN|nr:N-acetylmuramoyl-L-alanine amidase [Actinoplanes oblitus]WIM95063.1 N-acetylmuramoyl-L-alanine amidase [Actinoplanes oblitus]
MRRNRLVAAMVAATPAIALAIVGLAPAAAPPLLQTFALTGGLRLVADTGTQTAELPERHTKRFSLVGVTWDDPRAVAAGTIEVRTRPVGGRSWTPWQVLETDAPDESGGAAARGASDPLWVGPSNGVQARVIAAGGASALPVGMRVDLINPDADADAEAVAGENPAVMERASVETPDRPVPKLMTRAAWGANERIVKEAPSYTGPVRVFFVHHTATGNNYSCRSSTSVVRGIEAYQVKSKGWNDIGYNFLVDKCGTIFEGRRGGVTRNVLGAHTLGFNTNASAVAVIGDFRSAALSPAARLSVAQLAAYKLGAHGNAPAGRVLVTSGGGPKFPVGRRVTLNRISGHRDAGLTECPGDALYAQLPAIRRLAGGAPSGLHVAKVSRAWLWSGTYWTTGRLVPLWDLTTSTRMIARFDVYVDGERVLSRANWTRLGELRLGPGAHTVAIRAVHLSGRSSTVSIPVVADVTPPAFTALPQARLTAGTVGTSAPVQLAWTATDPAGLRGVQVTGTSEATLGGTVRSLLGTAPVGVASSWTVAATDHAGNRREATLTRTPQVLQESAATRTGTWRTSSDTSHLGGAAASAASGDASLTWSFSGSSAGLVVGRTTTSGRIKVYVDGDFQGYVDLRSTAPMYRRMVWTRSWPEGGEHTVRVVPEATSGRPKVIIDGLVRLG